MTQISVFNEFIAGTKIQSEPANENFNTIKSAHNDTDSRVSDIESTFAVQVDGTIEIGNIMYYDDANTFTNDRAIVDKGYTDSTVTETVNPDKVTLTAGTTNTLQEGKWHTLTNGSSSTTINMFTVLDSAKTSIAVINLTTSSTSQPSFSGITWDVTKRDWDTSKHNLVTIFSDNNGTTYHGNHRVLGA